MRRSAFIMIGFLLVGTLAACGGDDGASTAPPAGSESDDGDAPDPGPGDQSNDPEGEPGDQGGESGSGGSTGGGATVTADGETHNLDRVVNCDPPDPVVPEVEPVLMVSALGDNGIAVHVRVNDMTGSTAQDLDFYGPDAAFNGGAREMDTGWYDAVDELLPDAPLTITDDHISGTVTAVNTRATDETMVIDVDIPYPSEIIDC